MTPPPERPDFTDEVENFFQRSGGVPAEGAEIEEATALPAADLRPALQFLTETKVIEETDEGWKLIGGEDGDGVPKPVGSGEEAGDDEEGDGDEEREPIMEMPGPARDAHVAATFEVVCKFGKRPGESDDAAVTKAQAVLIEVGNAIGAAFPNLDFHIDLQGVDAFDKPRPLYPAPDDQQ